MQYAAFKAFSGKCVCRRYIASPTWWNSSTYIFGIETFSFFISLRSCWEIQGRESLRLVSRLGMKIVKAPVTWDLILSQSLSGEV